MRSLPGYADADGHMGPQRRAGRRFPRRRAGARRVAMNSSPPSRASRSSLRCGQPSRIAATACRVLASQRPALIGCVRQMAGDLQRHRPFGNVAPAGVLDHARQREVVGPGDGLGRPQEGQSRGQGMLGHLRQCRRSGPGNAKGQVMDLAFDAVVPVKGLEPSWGHPRLILSQLRIPFRHTGRQRASVTEVGRRCIVGGLMRAVPVGIGSLVAILPACNCLQER